VIALVAITMMISGAAAQDGNTSEIWNTTDLNISETYTGDPFTAESLENLTVNASIGTNESLEALVTGYNSTAETGNESFQFVDGVSKKEISSFSENTSTFTVEFEPLNGTVQVHNASVTGVDSDETVSGAAPGGLITGNFFAGLPNPLTAIADIFNSIASWIGGLIP